MSNVNALLNERLKKGERSSKVSSLTRESTGGRLTQFTGLFSSTELNAAEKEHLEEILIQHSENRQNIKEDLNRLIAITAEVKTITNQAALLHGERIQKAQTILKKYREGAFTHWLMAAYGNRQTPYNFLHYYEFHEAMPKELRPQIEAMPRQAIYSLASREGPLEKKRTLLKDYQGQTKAELLQMIRDLFPLKEQDQRKVAPAQTALNSLTRLHALLARHRKSLTKAEKSSLKELLKSLEALL